MISSHLTGFLLKHGRISKGALGRSSSTNLREIDPHVSTDYLFYFHACTIPSRDVLEKTTATSLSPLIQVSLPRRSNAVFTSANSFYLMSLFTINREVFWVNLTIIASFRYACPSHQTPQPFYTIFRRHKDHALRENYASDLQQVMIMHLSREGLTS